MLLLIQISKYRNNGGIDCVWAAYRHRSHEGGRFIKMGRVLKHYEAVFFEVEHRATMAANVLLWMRNWC